MRVHGDLRGGSRTPHENVPTNEDLLSAAELAGRLAALVEPQPSVAFVGDTMLGGRTRKVITAHGSDYPFASVRPLMQRAHALIGNLEGPFACHSARQKRNHSYRVNPRLADALPRAGFKVMTLANNHLLDCGREGVVETLEALEHVGVIAIGAGRDLPAAHSPAIVNVGGIRVGVLGYYWNRRTAATKDLPGSAMDPPEALAANIGALRGLVDRIVVTFHWGETYQRMPAAADVAKARLAVDLGADVVVGHHPHIVQPFEVYRQRPIFYSIGNFTFGTGNSRAEGLLLEFAFEKERTITYIYPLYVKNRDLRVAYQPKVLRGQSAARELRRLAEISEHGGRSLIIEEIRGRLVVPREVSAIQVGSVQIVNADSNRRRS